MNTPDLNPPTLQHGQAPAYIDARDGDYVVRTWSNGSTERWLYSEPSEPASTVPQRVTMRQARLALLAAGLLDDVEAAIAALPSPAKEAAKIEWEYSQEVHRTHGFVAQLGPALGLDDAALDALFVAAAGR